MRKDLILQKRHWVAFYELQLLFEGGLCATWVCRRYGFYSSASTDQVQLLFTTLRQGRSCFIFFGQGKCYYYKIVKEKFHQFITRSWQWTAILEITGGTKRFSSPISGWPSLNWTFLKRHTCCNFSLRHCFKSSCFPWAFPVLWNSHSRCYWELGVFGVWYLKWM